MNYAFCNKCNFVRSYLQQWEVDLLNRKELACLCGGFYLALNLFYIREEKMKNKKEILDLVKIAAEKNPSLKQYIIDFYTLEILIDIRDVLRKKGEEEKDE